MGEARVLFKTRRFSTFLHVDEDGRDPDNLVTSFTLIRSVGLFLPAIQTRPRRSCAHLCAACPGCESGDDLYSRAR